ncbi:MAG: hypothetical protein ACFNVH_01710 [Segatella maculosa]
MKRGGILSRDSLIASTSFVQYLFDAPQDGFYDDTVVKMHPKQVAIRVRQQLIHRNRSQTAVIAFFFHRQRRKTRNNAHFSTQSVTFTTETVSVLWLYKTMNFQAHRSFLNRYLYDLHFIAEHCALRT